MGRNTKPKIQYKSCVDITYNVCITYKSTWHKRISMLFTTDHCQSSCDTVFIISWFFALSAFIMLHFRRFALDRCPCRWCDVLALTTRPPGQVVFATQGWQNKPIQMKCTWHICDYCASPLAHHALSRDRSMGRGYCSHSSSKFGQTCGFSAYRSCWNLTRIILQRVCHASGFSLNKIVLLLPAWTINNPSCVSVGLYVRYTYSNTWPIIGLF